MRRIQCNGNSPGREFRPEQLILSVHHTHIHTDGGIGQVGFRVSGVFQCMPRRHQEKPLLGIHEFRFPWRNIEKQGIELIDIF